MRRPFLHQYGHDIINQEAEKAIPKSFSMPDISGISMHGGGNMPQIQDIFYPGEG